MCFYGRPIPCNPAKLTILAAIIFHLLPSSLSAQATLSGFITDASRGEALELVNVILSNTQNDQFGTSSTRDGLYQISGLQPGLYAIQASFVGFEVFRDTLRLFSDRIRILNISLEPSPSTLDEVVVEGDMRDSGGKTTAGQQTIRAKDIDRIPTLDPSGDLAIYMSALPGVVSAGDRGGQMFVRGGEPTQNLVRLDGITLFQPFHLLGFYSAFPSEIINSVDIYAGGFGSQFGERVSSVIDVWSRDGNKRSFGGSASISPFIGAASIEGPILKDRISFMGSARFSTISSSAPTLINKELPFNFGDFFAKVRGDRTGSRYSASLVHTYDSGPVRETVGGRSADEVRWTNSGVGLRYLFLPTILPIAADFRMSYSRLESEIGPIHEPSRKSKIQNADLSLLATHFGANLTARFGMDMRMMITRNDLNGQFQNLVFQNERVGPFSMFAEPEWDYGWLNVRAGLRLQLHHSSVSPFVEPRLRIIANKGPHQLSLALGKYSQELLGLSDRRDVATVFTAWSNVPRSSVRFDDIRVGRILNSWHGLIGYNLSPSPNLLLSAEGFYKSLNNLLIPEWTSYPRFTTELQPATGRSFGFDLRVELRNRYFHTYTSYGLSNTIYTAEQESIQLWYGREKFEFRPAHDRRHQLNVVFSSTLKGIDLNARWAFGSGLPFTRAIAFDGFSLVSDIVDISEQTGTRRVIYGPPYDAVLPTYHRFDVSIEKSFPLRLGKMTLSGSVINLYDRSNIFYVDLFTYERINQLPFIPSLGLRIEW